MRQIRTRYAVRALALLLSLGALPCACGTTVLITGANSGIGLEFTKEYIARGWTVIATHRRSETPASLAEIAAKSKNLRVEHLDVTNPDEAKALAARLANVPIDILINNAGVYNDRSGCKAEDEACAGDWTTQSFGNLDFKLLDTIMTVNVKGPLIVSQAFLGNVKASTQKKIVNISSSTGSHATPDEPRPGAIFYRSSKAALNRAMQSVAASLKDAGVTVVLLNPGPTLTERQMYLKSFSGMLTTPFTVGHMVDTIDKVTIKDSGHFLRYDGVTEPW
jgi:NAD(P)-dependent dehydrogenase (short-subunit alcohol dehydrogenase family)